MWKNINNNQYQELLKIHSSGYTLDILPYAVILSIFSGMIAIPCIWLRPDHPRILIPCALIIGITIMILIPALILHSKDKAIRRRLQEQNCAQSHPATIIRKYRRTDGLPMEDRACFWIDVSLEGRSLKVRTVKDIYTNFHIGDTVELIDLTGNKAASRYTCIATIPMPTTDPTFTNTDNRDTASAVSFGSGTYGDQRMNGAFSAERNNNDDFDNRVFSSRESGRVSFFRKITETERKKAIRIEKRSLTWRTILLCLLVLGTAGGWIAALTLYNALKIIAIVMSIFSVCYLLAYLVYLLCHRGYLLMLQEDTPPAQCVTVTEVQVTYHRSGRYNRAQYFYHFMNDMGQTEVIESNHSFSLRKGNKALIVCYDHDTTRKANWMIYRIKYTSFVSV